MTTRSAAIAGAGAAVFKTLGSTSHGAAKGGAPDGERGARVVSAGFSTNGSAGDEMAERGGRVIHPLAAMAKRPASGPSHATRLAKLERAISQGATPHDWLRSIPASVQSAVEAPMVFASTAQAATRTLQPAALERLAAFEPRPFKDSGSGLSQLKALGYAEDVRLPSFQSAVDANAAVAVDADPAAADTLPEGAIASVAMPIPRPQTQAAEGRQVASLEPRDLPSVGTTATDALAEFVAPLPQKRPNYRPSPSSSAAPAPATVMAYARPSAPASSADRDDIGNIDVPAARPGVPARNGGPSFFERLLGRGGSAQLPGAGSRIAVYEIKTATVYLPGDGRLEAHSGLGHMQDNPRYVTQKNRGPTPPDIYNLRMRESRFHGAEAIRLLPITGRKKYNRDGLLAHPYMYVGPGNDRSQSNGCVVFKDYPRFLKAFRKGRINQLIVVPSLDELPTYMARL